MKELYKFGGKVMLKNISKYVANTFFIIIVIFILLLIFSTKIQSNNYIKIPIIGKYKFMHVITGSMSPAIEAGDIIVTRSVDFEDLKKGDIITFKIGNKTLITHRIVGVNDNGSFVTKGDANSMEDIDLIVNQANIIGKYFIKIPKGGYILKFIQSPAGLIIFILIPAIMLIWAEIRSYNKEFKTQDKDMKQNK